jgi:hypothetical protein
MILLQYGLPKSGSTFLARLLIEASNSEGKSHEELRDRIFVGGLKSKRGFWGEKLVGLTKICDMLDPEDLLVIKTHEAPSQEVCDLINERKVIPFVSCRHPGDAALSVFEAGQKAIKAKDFTQSFHRYDTHKKSIDFVTSHINTVTMMWLKRFPENVFEYSKFTTDINWTKRRIAQLTGLDEKALDDSKGFDDLIAGREKVYNFNKGTSGRFAEYFTDDEIAYLEQNCSEYMNLMGYGRDAR